VEAGWKQCEQSPIAPEFKKSKLKNFTFSTVMPSVLGVIIPQTFCVPRIPSSLLRPVLPITMPPEILA
jgi:hypothetical protein